MAALLASEGTAHCQKPIHQRLKKLMAKMFPDGAAGPDADHAVDLTNRERINNSGRSIWFSTPTATLP